MCPTMTAPRHAHEAVTLGAKLLDECYPGWWWHIDMDAFSVRDPYTCPAAQAYLMDHPARGLGDTAGGWPRHMASPSPYTLAVHDMGLATNYQTQFDLGFLGVTYSLNDADATWDELDAAWRRLIETRKEARGTS